MGFDRLKSHSAWGALLVLAAIGGTSCRSHQVNEAGKLRELPAENASSDNSAIWFETDGFRLELTTVKQWARTQYLPHHHASTGLAISGTIQPPSPNDAFSISPGITITSIVDTAGNLVPFKRDSSGDKSLRPPQFIIPSRENRSGFSVTSPSLTLHSPPLQSVQRLTGKLDILWASKVEHLEMPFAVRDDIELMPGFTVSISKAAFSGGSVIMECQYIASNATPTYVPTEPPHLLEVHAIDVNGDACELNAVTTTHSIVNHQGLHQNARYSGRPRNEGVQIKTLRFSIATALTPVSIPFELIDVVFAPGHLANPEFNPMEVSKRPRFDHQDFRVELPQVSTSLSANLKRDDGIQGSLELQLLLHIPAGDQVWAIGKTPRITAMEDEAGQSLVASSESGQHPSKLGYGSLASFDLNNRMFSVTDTISGITRQPKVLSRVEGEIPVIHASRIEDFEIPLAVAEARELVDGFHFAIRQLEQREREHTVEFEFSSAVDDSQPFWKPPLFLELVALDADGKTLDTHRHAKLDRTHQGTFGSALMRIRSGKNRTPAALRVRVITAIEFTQVPFRFEHLPIGPLPNDVSK